MVIGDGSGPGPLAADQSTGTYSPNGALQSIGPDTGNDDAVLLPPLEGVHRVHFRWST